MTPAETSKLLAYIASLWPSLKPTKETAAAWSSILGSCDSRRVTAAVRDYAINAESPYAPTPQELFKTLRHQVRPERREASKNLALPGPAERVLTAEESDSWFRALHQHFAWIAANAGAVDQAEEQARRQILHEAWSLMWQKKNNTGWVQQFEEKSL